MARKKTLNLSVPAEILNEFDAVCRHYGHAKQKGMVLSAALLMFLRADPKEQGECLKGIATAQITAGEQTLLERIRREQADAVAARLAAAPRKPARKAAKRAGKSVHARKSVPDLTNVSKRVRKS